MPENEERVVAGPAGEPSRIIEYFPPGPTISAKDCKWSGETYSKGATHAGDDGAIYVCSGDKDGAWTPKKKV